MSSRTTGSRVDFYLNTLNDILNSEDQAGMNLAINLIERHSAEVLSVEGKGEWESDYFKISRGNGSKEEILFEKDS